MSKIWELDFYSRPIVDENNKKTWEVLICESLEDPKQSPDSGLRYAKFTTNDNVNSIFLKEAIEQAIEQAQYSPKKIRFFRRQMNNMIIKACQDTGIPASASRRTYTIKHWLAERSVNFYPLQSGYDEKLNQIASVQYPQVKSIALPDALRGDKKDKWSFVSLDLASLQEMNQWEIGFKEAFPLSLVKPDPSITIPGLVIYSSRSLPLAAWLSGLELAYLKLENKQLSLETGDNDSWILLNFADQATFSQASAFQQAIAKAKGLHFLAIQSDPNSESFSGFWLLWQDMNL
jgi:hypothetical protein